METCEKDSCDENTQFQSDPDKYSVTIFVGVTLKLVNLKWYFLYDQSINWSSGALQHGSKRRWGWSPWHINKFYDTDPREQRCMYCRLLPLTWRQHASLRGEGKRSRDSCVIVEGIKENGHQVDHWSTCSIVVSRCWQRLLLQNGHFQLLQFCPS